MTYLVEGTDKYPNLAAAVVALFCIKASTTSESNIVSVNSCLCKNQGDRVSGWLIPPLSQRLECAVLRQVHFS